ncbi:MAG: hypothetical protein RLO03_13950 [Balneola sp.]
MKHWTKQIEWSPDADAGTPVWNALGNIHLDSAHNPSTAQEETSSGQELYAGTQDVYEMRFYDEAEFTDLKAKQTAEETVDLRFTSSLASETPEVEKGFTVIVNKIKSFNPRTRQAYAARFVRTFI